MFSETLPLGCNSLFSGPERAFSSVADFDCFTLAVQHPTVVWCQRYIKCRPFAPGSLGFHQVTIADQSIEMPSTDNLLSSDSYATFVVGFAIMTVSLKQDSQCWQC